MANNRVMVGAYENVTQAKRAINDLQDIGISDDRIKMVLHEVGGHVDQRFLDMLIFSGISVEDAAYYRRELEAGHPIVLVWYSGSKQDMLTFLLDNVGPEQLSVHVTGHAGTKSSLQDSSVEGNSPSSPADLPDWWKLLKDAKLDSLLDRLDD